MFLNNGFAYVPSEFLCSVITPLFRQQLSRGLVITAGRWATSFEDEENNRLVPILKALANRCFPHLQLDSREYMTQGARKIELNKVVPSSSAQVLIVRTGQNHNRLLNKHAVSADKYFRRCQARSLVMESKYHCRKSQH